MPASNKWIELVVYALVIAVIVAVMIMIASSPWVVSSHPVYQNF